MMFTYNYPRPIVTVDCVILSYRLERVLNVLLIQRADEPFKGFWALPGGFLEVGTGAPDDQGEDLPVAAARELEEETGLTDVKLHQMFAVGTPGRDSRGRVITVVYTGCVDRERKIRAGSDAKLVGWVEVEGIKNGRVELAFDHRKILDMVLKGVHRG